MVGMTNYRNIKIPEELYQEVKKIVDSGELGYRSVSEFVIESIRMRLRELRQRA